MNSRRITIPDAELSVRIAGAGPTVLLIHGFPLDHTMWSGQLEALRDVQVIAPDLRGFGQSTGAIDEALAMSQLADDLAGLLAALELNQPIALCGLSMGGYIALEFWDRHPDRLAQLILCDTRAAADTAETAKGRQLAAGQVLAQGNRTLAESMVPRLFADRTAACQPELIQRVRHVVHETAPSTVAAALRGMAVRRDFTQCLQAIDLPALVICGSEDVITPAKEMQAMAEAMPSAQYVEVENAGHLAPLEQPTVVNQAIESFLHSASRDGD